MRSRSLVSDTPRTVRCQIARACQLFALIAVLGCLAGGPTAAHNTLWAQPPLPPAPPLPTPPLPPLPPVDDEEIPAIVDFIAIPFPGGDDWLISGQVIGCADPSQIGVAIGGVVSASAVTDVFGYFDVVVHYEGGEELGTADASYLGTPIPQAHCLIGG